MNDQRPKPIVSMQHLAWTIGVPIERLKQIADNIKRDRRSHYEHFALVTGKGKRRHIDHPEPELLEVQRRIVRFVLTPMGFGDTAHGGVRGRDAKTNAAAHTGKRCVVKMDVKNFYPSVQHSRVYRMFRHEHGYGEDVARLLTRLVTLRGALPQGAASSPAVANHFARVIDDGLKASAERHGLTITRYVDDFTISGDQPKLLIGQTTRLLKARGLRLAPEKLKVFPRGGPQEVTGLIVNHAERVTVSRHYRDAVRSSIHKLRDLEQHKWQKAIESIKGKIAHIEQYNKGPAARLRRYLADVTSEGI